MNLIILILTALVSVAVLAGVALVVMGKGGQLARFEADHPPLDLPADGSIASSDVTRVLIPLSLWGYHVRAVDEVLARLATALRERDARIADLEHRLAEQPRSAAPQTLSPRPQAVTPTFDPETGSRGPDSPETAESAESVRAAVGHSEEHPAEQGPRSDT
ncbi:hypothetical protein [Salinactinospora qingdaonensis]|uniref:DivIVA domain-containing protein n=1 Tax=Salinactinospora qingdaonensis TaxID=702744 RepID=A0ABP7FKS9_9ACTN